MRRHANIEKTDKDRHTINTSVTCSMYRPGRAATIRSAPPSQSGDRRPGAPCRPRRGRRREPVPRAGLSGKPVQSLRQIRRRRDRPCTADAGHRRAISASTKTTSSRICEAARATTSSSCGVTTATSRWRLPPIIPVRQRQEIWRHSAIQGDARLCAQHHPRLAAGLRRLGQVRHSAELWRRRDGLYQACGIPR